jgi:hypothetical protein
MGKSHPPECQCRISTCQWLEERESVPLSDANDCKPTLSIATTGTWCIGRELFLAQTRNAAMSAIPPLLGDKRTLRGEPISVAIDRVEMWRGGFRWNMLERSPGGACTHCKAPPCHGAHPEQTF